MIMQDTQTAARAANENDDINDRPADDEAEARATGDEEERLSKLFKACLQYALSGDLRLFLEMLEMHIKGIRGLPDGDLAVVVVALTYLVITLDAIPDYLPVVGFTDDVTVAAICMNQIRNSVIDFKDWKENNQEAYRRGKEMSLFLWGMSPGDTTLGVSQVETSDEALKPHLSDPKQTQVITNIIISLIPVLFLIPLMLGSWDLRTLDAAM